MLAYNLRFHRRNSVQYVQKNGSATRHNQLSVKNVPNNRDSSRYAVVVSKKVAKSAVTRNRIRRRAFEIIRKNLSSFETGQDIVLSVFDKDVATVDSQKLESEVLQIFRKAQLFKG